MYTTDKFLSSTNIDDYVIISSDIFDTLVYRICAEPSDVFLKVGRRAKEKFKGFFPFNGESYKEIRKKAEIKARNHFKEKEEITYKEIFNFLPFEKEVKDFLMVEEILQEKQHLVLNENVYSFLKFAKKQGKVIVLASDMYLSEFQIKGLLLSTGVDLTLFDNIYVSSDLDKTKSKGTLYQHILAEYPHIASEKILHIGDNHNSDVIQAQKKGIHCIYYNVMNEDMFSIFHLETSLTETPANEIRSLRKIAGNTSKYVDEELMWYQLGAQIFGPVYSIFTDWIVTQAANLNIKKILPLMREGILFEKLLRNSVKSIDLNIEIDILEVSRKSTYLPTFKQDKNMIKELLERKLLTIKDLFSLLLLKLECTMFNEYCRYRIDEIKNVMIDGKVSLFEHLKKYLYSDVVQKEIELNAKIQRGYLQQYLRDMTQGEAFLTVDLGGNATIQSQIDEIMGDDHSATHAVFASRNTAMDKVLHGLKLFSWMGYASSENKKLKSFFRSPEIIEAITNSMQPGISHFASQVNGKVKAQLNSITYPAYHVKMQQICWEGMLDFQERWTSLRKKKEIKELLINNTDGLMAILHRLITYPTTNEAKLLGALIQDDNVHYSRYISIINENDIQLLSQIGSIDKFLLENKEGYTENQIYWPQGVVALHNPVFFLKQYVYNGLNDATFIEIYNLINKIEKDKYKCICLYGAGEMGEKILKVSNLFQLSISYFIDRNFEQMSSGIQGIPVINNANLGEEIDLIIISSKAFQKDIHMKIEESYQGEYKPKVIGFQ